jgi:endonuclease YncB( thermonuclease family)
MRPQPTVNKPIPNWMAKSALDRNQEMGDFMRQDKPAYQRAGKMDPYKADVLDKLDRLGKPKIDYKDYQAQLAKQKELQQQLKDPRPAVWKDPRTGVVSKSPPPMNAELPKPLPGKSSNYSLANDPVGRATPGEPTMGSKPPAERVPTNSAPSPNAKPSVIPSVANTAGNQVGQSALKAAGKKMLTKVIPGVGVAVDAADAYNRYKNKDYLGATIAGTGAVAGLVPGLGTAASWGAMGLNQAIDHYKKSPGAQAATPQAPAQLAPAQQTTNPVTPAASSTAPAASQSRSITPSQSQTTSGYKGSTGAQSIQQANSDKITNVNKINAGDTIKVNGNDYKIKQGDTLDAIAKKNPTATPTNEQESNTLNRIKSLAGLK